MHKNIKHSWKLGREEFGTQHFDVTKRGELLVKEGYYQYNIHELFKKYGSTLEIFFPFIVESRLRRLGELFQESIRRNAYKGRFFYHYPMKVNQGKECVLALIAEGANLETSSANELWLVKRLWEQGNFNARIRVLCNGPKTDTYISLIDELDRKRVIITPIIEAREEFEKFKRFQGEVGVRADLNMKVRSHWDKKFNHFGFQEEDILKMGKIRNLGLLSYHISSQIEKLDGLSEPIKRAVMLYAKVREQNPQLDTIDIGGGAGIPYEKKKFYSIAAAANRVVRTFKHYCRKYDVREPNIICEWGRYVAAPAQITIFSVLTEKEVGNGSARKWYTVDGSFINDLPDTWAIHQKWHVVPVHDMGSKPLQKVWLAGSSCDSDDKYTAGGGTILLPKLDERKDLAIAVLDTGAYQDALASYHCLLSRPAKLIAQNGQVTLVRRRQGPEHIGKKFGW